jgi:hypothetical protein
MADERLIGQRARERARPAGLRFFQQATQHRIDQKSIGHIHRFERYVHA